MVSLQDYESKDPVAWCPGCGNFSLLSALKEALAGLGKRPHEIAIVSGIGQASKIPHYLMCNAFNGLHGRTLPTATGLKLANHELTVIAEGGDGDGYAEGGNHFIHAMRRNVDITYLVHDNQVYGLTKGQTSPTSEKGYVSNTTPWGSTSPPENPLLLAIASDCSFVARGFTGDIPHLTQLIQAGIRNKGFSFIDILQPCVSFNRVNTFQWYNSRVQRIEEEEGYDAFDRTSAFQKAQEWGERIPIGILYKSARPTREEQEPVIEKTSLVKQPLKATSFPRLLEAFE